MPIKITVKLPSGEKQVAQFHSNRVTVGRSHKCDMLIALESLSRQHCFIEYENDSFYITDTKSSNGVMIDGERITADVKTPFASFNNLHIGPLECSVELIEEPSPTYEPRPRPVTTDQTLTKKLKVPPAPKKRAKTRDKKGFILPVLVLLGAVYYYNENKETTLSETEQSQESVSEATTPEAKVIIPNTFKTAAIYLQEKPLADCKNFASYCDNLKLDTTLGEGIVQDKSEFSLYLIPSRHSNNPDYDVIKNDPRALDLIAFNLFFTSKIMEDYFQSKMTQLHVILMDDDKKPFKVYRFDSVTFNSNTVPYIDMVEQLKESLKTGDSKKFWELIDKDVPVLRNGL